MWTMLIHLGGNMWNEEGNIRDRETNLDAVASSTLRLDRKMWDDYMLYQRECGVNTLILSLIHIFIFCEIF